MSVIFVSQGLKGPPLMLDPFPCTYCLIMGGGSGGGGGGGGGEGGDLLIINKFIKGKKGLKQAIRKDIYSWTKQYFKNVFRLKPVYW